MKPTTAVILAAGTGTRLLPVTSAVQKELLPVLNRPVVDYVVADLIAAGIERIVFVVRPDQTGLQDYYAGNPGYEDTLKRLGKTTELAALQRIHYQAKFEFVAQTPEDGYGTAAGAWAGLRHISNDRPVVVCSGDDFIWNHGASVFEPFFAAFANSEATSALMTTELDDATISRLAALDVRRRGTRDYLSAIAEKPAVGEAPSNLANISKYILSPALQQMVAKVEPRPENTEKYITDALTDAAQSEDILVYKAKGQYLDTGTVGAWLHANQVIAGAQTPDLSS